VFLVLWYFNFGIAKLGISTVSNNFERLMNVFMGLKSFLLWTVMSLLYSNSSSFFKAKDSERVGIEVVLIELLDVSGSSTVESASVGRSSIRVIITTDEGIFLHLSCNAGT
jgi:hypothetical protein